MYPFVLPLAPGRVVRIGAKPGLLLLHIDGGGYEWRLRNVHDVVLAPAPGRAAAGGPDTPV